jgi:hypothetical protein
MSYPYPQDRHRDRKEEGEQPYKDAREAMAQEAAEIQAGAESFGESREADSNEAGVEDLQERVEERLRDVGESRREEREQS